MQTLYSNAAVHWSTHPSSAFTWSVNSSTQCCHTFSYRTHIIRLGNAFWTMLFMYIHLVMQFIRMLLCVSLDNVNNYIWFEMHPFPNMCYQFYVAWNVVDRFLKTHGIENNNKFSYLDLITNLILVIQYVYDTYII